MQQGMEQNRSWMNERMNQYQQGRGTASGSSNAGGPYVAGGVIVHRCSICGRTNLTNPDLTFRYCSKCAGNHEYCQEHLFTHVHVK